MDFTEITFSRRPPTAFLTLDNPAKINALSRRMIAEISEVLQELSRDENVKVLVIRAAGDHFCAGHDLGEMVGRDMHTYQRIFDDCSRMMQMLHDLPQVVIAQVQGIATAAGCQLAAWCDLVVAAENARFATPGVKIGLFCATPMVALTRAIGRKAAMEMLMTGRYVPATEARALGLVNRVVPLERLAGETRKLAESICQASGLVIAMGKRAFYTQVDQPDDKALSHAAHTIALNNLAEDAQAGITAFLEKTTPRWRNR